MNGATAAFWHLYIFQGRAGKRPFYWLCWSRKNPMQKEGNSQQDIGARFRISVIEETPPQQQPQGHVTWRLKKMGRDAHYSRNLFFVSWAKIGSIPYMK